MAKLHVTITFENSDKRYRFIATKPGRHSDDDIQRIRKALHEVPNIGIPILLPTRNPGPGLIFDLEEISGSKQVNAKADIQVCLRKAGYKRFIPLSE